MNTLTPGRIRTGVLFLLVVMGCSQAQKSSTKSSVHGFTVRLTYSEAAKKLLIDKKETIVVFADIEGKPRKDTPKRYLDDIGRIDWGEPRLEIAVGKDAVFPEVYVDSRSVAYTDEVGPELVINVASGRKSSEWNLLDCDFYDGPLKDVQDKVVMIPCQLIGETPPLELGHAKIFQQ